MDITECGSIRRAASYQSGERHLPSPRERPGEGKWSLVQPKGEVSPRWFPYRVCMGPTLAVHHFNTNAMTPLASYLLLSAALFSIGLAGALTRRHAILVLVGIELMLNAANLNFIAFWRYSAHPESIAGVMFVIFSIAVAAAEAAVGLALIIAIYRHYQTVNLDQVDS